MDVAGVRAESRTSRLGFSLVKGCVRTSVARPAPVETNEVDHDEYIPGSRDLVPWGCGACGHFPAFPPVDDSASSSSVIFRSDLFTNLL